MFFYKAYFTFDKLTHKLNFSTIVGFINIFSPFPVQLSLHAVATQLRQGFRWVTASAGLVIRTMIVASSDRQISTPSPLL